jgi:hypothetical protein
MKVTGFSIIALGVFSVAKAQEPPKGRPPGKGALNTPEGLASVGTGKYSPPVRFPALKSMVYNLTAD